MRIIREKNISQFKLYLYEEEKAQKTIEKYTSDIRFFMEWLDGRGVEKSLVLEYKKTLCDKYAPNSINSKLSSLNTLFEFMEWCDLKVKTLKIQKNIFACKEKELTKADYERLLLTARKKGKQRLYYLMQTICATGIRVSELKFITVEAIKEGKAAIKLKGKIRVVIIPEQLSDALKNYAEERGIKEGAIFVSKNGNPLDRSNIWSEMKGLCISAGVPEEKVFPHNLRHLFARIYYSIQKDVVRLADILGHSNVNTTRIYTMDTGEEHRRQIQKLGLVKC